MTEEAIRGQLGGRMEGRGVVEKRSPRCPPSFSSTLPIHSFLGDAQRLKFVGS